MGAVTPGRSRTHANATSSGDRPRPSAAVATAVTTRCDSAPRKGSTNEEKCGEAARLSAGIPPRYLPVRTPRPSGDQGSRPRPRALQAGSTSRSTPRWSREYSIWVLAIGARPGQARCHVAACAVCHPE